MMGWSKWGHIPLKLLIDSKPPNEVQRPGLTVPYCGENWWMVTFYQAQGYHHMEIEKEARALLGFQVGWRWYCYHIMPFGLWLPVGLYQDRALHAAEVTQEQGLCDCLPG